MNYKIYLICILCLLILSSAIFILNRKEKKDFNLATQNAKHEQEKSDESSKPKIDFQAKIDEFINEGPDFLEKSIYKTIDEIISKLGKAINIRETKVKNIHNPEVIDTVYELFYDGLYIKNYSASVNDKGWVEHISITKNNYKLKYDINIGSNRPHIKNTFGAPQEARDNRWTYSDSVGYADTVKFYFNNDTVIKIEWNYWID